MTTNQIIFGDYFNEIKNIQDESIDLIICDGPYAVTNHQWDKVENIQQFNLNLIKDFARVLKSGGAAYIFGKFNAFHFTDYTPFLTLNREIVWFQPARLAQGRKNYTNNYDIIGYFSKGPTKTFNLDAIRVEQMVSKAHQKRCESVPSVKEGTYIKTKFNVNGKNPGDVWADIKQLTYKSKELLSGLHTIQKPEKLIERLVKASSNENDLILSPFAGTGTDCKVAENLNRQYIGFENNENYFNIAAQRLK